MTGKNLTDGRTSKFLINMGEDRVAFAEKKNGDVLPSRQRHSSVISSCSEDAESETTSTGYPPTPDEEKEEELEYGPGIVNKLRTRFLTISLKQNRGTIRRSCSMENLLDQDRLSKSSMFPQTKFNANNKDTEERKSNAILGNLKRAKSMDTLLMDLQQSEPVPVPEINGDIKKEPKIVRRRDGCLNRTGPTICDEELPKPDTVKTYKRMFEPAESRRGSYSRRPPVLRASAKSGSLSVSKINGVSSSAKVNGTVSKSKISAKQSPPVKAQLESELISNDNSKKPLVNGEHSIPLCNGNYVKATPMKVTDSSLCNGKVEKKTAEKDMNGHSTCKKNLYNNQKNGVVCNGNSSPLKELIKTQTNEDFVKPEVKKLVNQTYKVLNGSETLVPRVLNGLTGKPKVPPNRPAFIKNVRPVSKTAELNGIDKKSPSIPKLKPVPHTIHKKIPEVAKPEVKRRLEETVISEPRLNGEVIKESKDGEIKKTKLTNDSKIVLENNKWNVEKVETKVTEVDKTDFNPKKEVEKEVPNHMNGNIVDSEILAINHKPESLEVKTDPKPVKKQQLADSITTSMVFDFRGKDVVPHVAVLPVPFGCKALHPKKKSLLIDGKEAPNGSSAPSDDEEEYHGDYSVPAPSGVVFEGENIKIGKGSILSIRNKDVSIFFF